MCELDWQQLLLLFSMSTSLLCSIFFSLYISLCLTLTVMSISSFALLPLSFTCLYSLCFSLCVCFLILRDIPAFTQVSSYGNPFVTDTQTWTHAHTSYSLVFLSKRRWTLCLARHLPASVTSLNIVMFSNRKTGNNREDKRQRGWWTATPWHFENWDKERQSWWAAVWFVFSRSPQ